MKLFKVAGLPYFETAVLLQLAYSLKHFIRLGAMIWETFPYFLSFKMMYIYNLFF